MYKIGFPGGLVVKNLPAKAGDAGDAGPSPGSGRPPGEENGNPLQYFSLGNSMDGGTWPATVRGVTKESDTEGGNRQNRLCLESGTSSWAGLRTLSSMPNFYANDIPTGKPGPLDGRTPGLIPRLSIA